MMMMIIIIIIIIHAIMNEHVNKLFYSVDRIILFINITTLTNHNQTFYELKNSIIFL